MLLQRNNNNEKSGTDLLSVKEKFYILRDAITNLDAGIINSTVEDILKNKDFGTTGIVIDLIAEKILFGEYDAALAVINTFLAESDDD